MVEYAGKMVAKERCFIFDPARFIDLCEKETDKLRAGRQKTALISF